MPAERWKAPIKINGRYTQIKPAATPVPAAEESATANTIPTDVKSSVK